MDAVLQQSSATVKQGNRIDVLRVLLTVGIVCRHATSENLSLVVWVTSVCVPAFFALSGYLFFCNAPQKPALGWFGKKYKSRFFTLVIPYLLAVVIAWICYFCAMKLAPALVSGEFFADRWKNPLFVFWTGPINLSLWFIRELIVLVILSPLIWLLVRYTTWFGVLALGILWAFKLGGPEPLFFFSAGACLGVHKMAPVERWLHLSSRIPTSSRAWSYFIYLYHYLFLIGVKKGLALLLHPAGVWADTGVWLASVVIVLAVLTGGYILMRRIAPRLTGLLVGGK